MADLKLIKTKDINKVPHKANQLIFTDDGSMYFDYSNTIRLHNSGGAHLEDFIAGKEYLKYDMCVYRGLVYRAKVDCIDYTFVNEHWQLITLGGGGSETGEADSVNYDGSSSGLSATTVQQAIDQLAEIVNLVNEGVSSIVVSVNEIDMKVQQTHKSIEQLSESIDISNEKVDDLSKKVDEHINKAITTESEVELDTF